MYIFPDFSLVLCGGAATTTYTYYYNLSRFLKEARKKDSM